MRHVHLGSDLLMAGHVVDLDGKSDNVLPKMGEEDIEVITIGDEHPVTREMDKGSDGNDMGTFAAVMGNICCCVFLPALIMMSVFSTSMEKALNELWRTHLFGYYMLVWLFLPALIMMIVILTMSDGFSWVAYIDQSSGLCDDFGFVSAAARGSGL